MGDCFSQNKNRHIFAYLQGILNKSPFQTTMYVNYPLPKNNRIPCDREFGRIEKRGRKKDRVILPSRWVSYIKGTDLSSSFNAILKSYVEHSLTDNMMDDRAPVVKVLDFKKVFDSLLKIITIFFERGKEPLSRIR